MPSNFISYFYLISGLGYCLLQGYEALSGVSGDLLPSKRSLTPRYVHYDVNTVVNDDWTLLFETKAEYKQVICS